MNNSTQKEGRTWREKLYGTPARCILAIAFALSLLLIGCGLAGIYIWQLHHDLSYQEIARSRLGIFSSEVHTQPVPILSSCRIVFLALGILLSAASVILLVLTCGKQQGSKEIRMRRTDRVPYLFLFLVCVIPAFLTFSELYTVVSYFFRWRSIAILYPLLCISAALLLLLLLSTITRIRARRFKETTLVGYLHSWYGRHCEQLPFHRWRLDLSAAWHEKNTFRKRAAVIMAILTAAELWSILVFSSPALWILWFFYKLITLPLFFRMLAERTLVKKKIRAIARGETEDTQADAGKKLFYDNQEDMDLLNQIQEGVRTAVDRQMKSERMKTELITNVSHDIKTPLTSIISYTDLLQKNRDSEDFSEEKEREYLSVLSRQSTKLKKLIEDLIEASKATTGNLDVKIEKVDVYVLLSQAAAEFEDRLKKENLTLVVNHQAQDRNQDYIAPADGRYLWRVFDNLLSNICKYSLPGTRVYVDLTRTTEGSLVVCFRNISRDPLNISADELMERFVRGDASRSTEGNGLGLSIADSLLKLMGGKLILEIDGDLFKASARLREA